MRQVPAVVGTRHNRERFEVHYGTKHRAERDAAIVALGSFPDAHVEWVAVPTLWDKLRARLGKG